MTEPAPCWSSPSQVVAEEIGVDTRGTAQLGFGGLQPRALSSPVGGMRWICVAREADTREALRRQEPVDLLCAALISNGLAPFCRP